ncbi:MAG: hypothetical protein Harvfovirus17_11 [Harvfovirus sp.]|uniref:Uncharacterized protein n=1 Tax=Harvfovirus sp. TaxID=2487768 RepID=A0A3G5A1M6_9VIRU|nr:MAG: hypothetical protein Harvfovirus17_11 [Harvfovirus sp.]
MAAVGKVFEYAMAKVKTVASATALLWDISLIVAAYFNPLTEISMAVFDQYATSIELCRACDECPFVKYTTFQIGCSGIFSCSICDSQSSPGREMTYLIRTGGVSCLKCCSVCMEKNGIIVCRRDEDTDEDYPAFFFCDEFGGRAMPMSFIVKSICNGRFRPSIADQGPLERIAIGGKLITVRANKRAFALAHFQKICERCQWKQPVCLVCGTHQSRMYDDGDVILCKNKTCHKKFGYQPIPDSCLIETDGSDTIYCRCVKS